MAMYRYSAVVTPEQVTRTAAGEVACGGHHTQRYSYRTAPAEPAVGIFVQFDYKDHAESIVFACKKHRGNLRSLIGRGTREYSPDRVREVTPDVLIVTVDEAALNPGRIIVAYENIRRNERVAAKQSRDAYIAQHRLQELLDADSELSRTVPGDIETVTDEYGATQVHIKLNDGYYGKAKLSVVNARAVAKALLVAADIAHALNVAAIEKETAK